MLEKKSQWFNSKVVNFWGRGNKVKQIKDTKDEQSTKQCFLILNRRKIQVWLLYKHNMAGT